MIALAPAPAPLSYGGFAEDHHGAAAVPELQDARARAGRASGRVRDPGRGRPHPRELGQADQGRRRRGGRLRRPHADARPHRQPRACLPERGEHPLPRGRAADADDRPRRRAHARHDRPRLHHRARHRRRRLGHQDGGRAGQRARAAALHRRPGDRADRRPFRSAPAHRFRHALPLLQCHGLHHGGVGRRVRGAQGRTRADAPGRRPREDHDVGRRRKPLRPARIRSSSARPKSRPRSRRRRLSAAMSAPTPIRRRRSPAPPMPACARSSTAT